MEEGNNPERRKLLKKATYIAPAIVSMSVISSIASAGSGPQATSGCNNGIGNGSDCTPPGEPFDNDQDPNADTTTGPNSTWKNP